MNSSGPASVEVAGPPTRGITPSSTSHGALGLSDHQTYNVIGVVCMLLVMCLIAVGGRFKARRLTKAHLGIDDYLALVALVLFVALSVQQFFIASCLLTVTRKFPPDLTMLKTLAKVEVASQITYVFLLTAARASILFLYRRIFTLTSRWFRIAWYANTFIALGFCIALLVSLAFECAPKPLSTLWTSPSECIVSHKDPVIIGFMNVLIDISILILPIRMVWTLQMSAKRRIAVCCIFGLGLTGVAVSIARSVAFISPTISSPTGAVSFEIWSTTEGAVALLCACLPLLRPVVTSFYEVLSTYHTNTISSFGLKRTKSKPPPNALSSHHGRSEEDNIPMWPITPEATKEKTTGFSVESGSVESTETRQEV